MLTTDLRKETSKRPANRYTGLGAALAAELMIGFWLRHWSHFSHWGSGRLESLCWNTYER